MSSEDQQALRLRLVYFMRRFLLLALGMGFLLPTAASAERVWMILTIERLQVQRAMSAMEKVEMTSMDECLSQGKAWRESYEGVRNFWCITGK